MKRNGDYNIKFAIGTKLIVPCPQTDPPNNFKQCPLVSEWFEHARYLQGKRPQGHPLSSKDNSWHATQM